MSKASISISSSNPIKYSCMYLINPERATTFQLVNDRNPLQKNKGQNPRSGRYSETCFDFYVETDNFFLSNSSKKKTHKILQKLILK